jgi:D-xylulose reductase
MCALSVLAGGCSRVFVTDSKREKLDIAGSYPGITPIDITKEDALKVVRGATEGWGAEVVIEASGAAPVYPGWVEYACPGGRAVLVGIPIDPVPFDVAAIQAKELDIASVFRYANIYPRAIELVASGKIDVKKLVSKVYPFEKSIEAFEHAAKLEPNIVKIQIEM